MTNSDRAGGLAEVRASYETREQLDAAKASNTDYFEIGVVSVLFELSENDNPAFDAIFSALEQIDYPLSTGEDEECQQHSWLKYSIMTV